MLVKTGLLIVSNPKQIGKILPLINNNVKNILYIQLLSALTEPFGNFYTNIFNTWPKYSKTIFDIYKQAATYCKHLDVRVLLSGIKYNTTQKIYTNSNIELIIFDKKYSKNDIDNFIKKRIYKLENNFSTLTLDQYNDTIEFNLINDDSNYNVHKHTVLGGTFDRLHLAHKILLSEAVLRSNSLVTIGITNENMLKNKLLWELIEDINIRIENLRNFLMEICPELTYKIVTISDPFGPAISDPTMDLIIVSEETVKGGTKINEIRQSKHLKKLEIIPVSLIDEISPRPIEEKKISSSTVRIQLLGTLLRPVYPNPNIPNKPYIIGLTGGIASGKSSVTKWLALLDCEIINCDIIGHNIYMPGKPCYYKIIETFSNDIVGDDKLIDRKKLGAIVFNNSNNLKTLNELVWPEIANDIKEIIKNTNKKVVIIEAAILLTANWNKMCHEIWSIIITKNEQLKRLIEERNLTEQQALQRINSQQSNIEIVKQSNVVLSTLWEPKYTKEQVDKAWKLLQERIV